MGIRGGPGIITDGLVLCLDKYDEDSYAGEPTTNTLDSPLDVTNGSYWARGNTAAQSSWSTGHPDPFGGTNATLFSSDADAGYPHIQQGGVTNSTNSWTFSAYMKTVSGATTIELTCFRASPWAGNFGVNVYKTLTTSWQRFVMTGTPQDSSWGTFHIIRHASVAPAMSYLVAYPQAEENSHVTKFVDGSRSATDGWKDLSGNENHADLTSLTYTTTSIPGTPRGGTPSSPVRGHYRNDFSFNGSSDYVSIPDSSDWNIGTGDFAVEMWINSDTNGSFALFNHYQGSNVDFRLIHHSSLGLLLYVNNTVYPSNGQNAVTLTANAWHHIVFTRVGGKNLKYYLDNTVVAEDASFTTNIQDYSGALEIGRTEQSSYFDGEIAITRFYVGRGLTTSEVSQHFNAHRSKFGV